MSPDELKTLRIILATFKFEIEELIEESIKKVLSEKRPKKYVEVGYRG
jgi:hypothetical protein